MPETQEEIGAMLQQAQELPEPVPTEADQHLREFRIQCETIHLWRYYQGAEYSSMWLDHAPLDQEAEERIDEARVRLWERLTNLLKEHGG